MAYAVSADLDSKWGSDQVTLASLDPTTGQRDANRVAAALDAASARMDGYFCKRYTLPIDAASNGVILLRNICCDLAMGELANTPGARNEIVEAAEKKALDFLTLVANGKADIPQNPPPATPGSAIPAAVSPNEPIVAANNREFTRSRLRGM